MKGNAIEQTYLELAQYLRTEVVDIPSGDLPTPILNALSEDIDKLYRH